MGFIDHSTNNIIIDTVLTDIGRKLLARNDGSFSIVKFAFGDDEVDYTTIEKYGRTVGRERIEKNTPVFEAQTNANIALKYPLVSLSNPNIVRLPRFDLNATGLSGNTLSMDTGVNSTRSLTLEQTIRNANLIEQELVDTTFLVRIPNRFLQLVGETPDFVDINDVAQYVVFTAGQTNSQGGAIVQFTLQTKSLTPNQFSVFGTQGNKNIIEVVANIQGVRSGTQKDILIQITKV
jgi:hypothetical protein